MEQNLAGMILICINEVDPPCDEQIQAFINEGPCVYGVQVLGSKV